MSIWYTDKQPLGLETWKCVRNNLVIKQFHGGQKNLSSSFVSAIDIL